MAVFTSYDKTRNTDEADVELKATTTSYEEVSFVVDDLHLNLSVYTFYFNKSFWTKKTILKILFFFLNVFLLLLTF